MAKCSFCGSEKVETLDDNSCVVCTSCGNVLPTSIFQDDQTRPSEIFSTKPLDPKSPYFRRTRKDDLKLSMKNFITNACHRLQLSGLIDRVAFLFEKWIDLPIYHERNDVMALACVYYVAIQDNKGVSITQISNMFGLKVSIIHKCYRNLCQALDLTPSQADITCHIETFTSSLYSLEINESLSFSSNIQTFIQDMRKISLSRFSQLSRKFIRSLESQLTHKTRVHSLAGVVLVLQALLFQEIPLSMVKHICQFHDVPYSNFCGCVGKIFKGMIEMLRAIPWLPEKLTNPKFRIELTKFYLENMELISSLKKTKLMHQTPRLTSSDKDAKGQIIHKLLTTQPNLKDCFTDSAKSIHGKLHQIRNKRLQKDDLSALEVNMYLLRNEN